MKMLTFAGSHACGKTSVIIKTAAILNGAGLKTGVMKLDCIFSDDDRLYEAAGITNLKLISGNVCPDHFFASSAQKVFEWGVEKKLDVLITESAGLCGRCAPHIRDIPAVCVIDCLAGISAPSKTGPMLRYADHIIITKADLVSPAEREVFLYNVRTANNRAGISLINGLTGQGSYRLAEYIRRQEETDGVRGKYLRFTMPSAECSYCAGQMVIDDQRAGGRIKYPWTEKNVCKI